MKLTTFVLLLQVAAFATVRCGSKQFMFTATNEKNGLSKSRIIETDFETVTEEELKEFLELLRECDLLFTKKNLKNIHFSGLPSDRNSVAIDIEGEQNQRDRSTRPASVDEKNTLLSNEEKLPKNYIEILIKKHRKSLSWFQKITRRHIFKVSIIIISLASFVYFLQKKTDNKFLDWFGLIGSFAVILATFFSLFGVDFSGMTSRIYYRKETI